MRGLDLIACYAIYFVGFIHVAHGVCTTQPSDPANGAFNANCANTADGGTCYLTCAAGYLKTRNALCVTGNWDLTGLECVDEVCTGSRLPPSSSCAAVLDYDVVVTGAQGCLIQAEASLEKRLWTSASTACQQALINLQCMVTYKPCGASSTGPPPSRCAAVVAACVTSGSRGPYDVQVVNMSLPYAAGVDIETRVAARCDASASAGDYVLKAAPAYVATTMPVCEPYAGSICSGVASGLVYRPAGGLDQSFIESFLVPLRLLQQVARPDCGSALLRTVCSTAFPRCDVDMVRRNIGVDVPAAAARLACGSMCHETDTCVSPATLAATGYSCNSKLSRACCGNATTAAVGWSASSTCTLPFSQFPGPAEGSATVTPGFPGDAYAMTRPMVSPCVTVPPPAYQCQPLNTSSACARVLDYSSVGGISVRAGTCWDHYELSMDTRTWAVLTPGCRAAVAKYQCTRAYPQCNGTEPKYVNPPPSVCQEIMDSCFNNQVDNVTVVNLALGGGFPPVCNGAEPGFYAATTQISPLTYAHCETYLSTGSCAGVLPENALIYVPSGATQASMEVDFAKRAFILPIIPRGACVDSMVRMLCQASFPLCNNTLTHAGGVAVPVPFFSFPCRSACNAADTNCPGVLAQGGASCSDQQTIESCDGSTLFTTEQFPFTANTLPPFPGQISTMGALAPYTNTKCNPANSEIRAYPLQATTCPYPFVFAPGLLGANHPEYDGFGALKGGVCGIPCLSPIFTLDDWEHLWNIMVVILPISLTCIIIMCLTFLVLPEFKNKYVAKWFVISCACYVFFFSFNIFDGRRENGDPFGITCHNDWEPNQQQNGGMCTFSSLVSHFFLYSSAAFWACFSFDIMFLVTFSMRKESRIEWIKEHRYRVYHVFAWSFASLMSIIVLSEAEFGANGIFGFCFYTSSKVVWGTLIGPLFVILAFGVSFFFVMLYVLSKSTGTTTRRDKCKLYIRPCMHVFVATCIFMFDLTMLSVILGKEDEIREKMTAWFHCVLLDQPRGVLPACPKPDFLNYGAWISFHVATALLGIFPFLLYLNKAMIVGWKNQISYWVALCTSKFTGAPSPRLSRVGSGLNVDLSHDSKLDSPRSQNSPKNRAKTIMLSDQSPDSGTRDAATGGSGGSGGTPPISQVSVPRASQVSSNKRTPPSNAVPSNGSDE